MILHNDGLIELRYDIKTDVLFVRWPDVNGTPASAIAYSFKKLLDTINYYNITKLLLNSKHTKVDVDNEAYKPLTLQLGKDLAGTRLQKIARIPSELALRESKAQESIKELKSTIALSFITKEFADEASALAWLTGNEAGSSAVR